MLYYAEFRDREIKAGTKLGFVNSSILENNIVIFKDYDCTVAINKDEWIYNKDYSDRILRAKENIVANEVFDISKYESFNRATVDRCQFLEMGTMMLRYKVNSMALIMRGLLNTDNSIREIEWLDDCTQLVLRGED